LLQDFGAALRHKHVYLACFILHFVLILLVTCYQTLSVIAQGDTILPRSWDSSLRYADTMAAAALGQSLATSNPVRQAITAYTNIAGIDTGYGFFAPNVSVSHKLVFEVRYSDGRVEYELPRVGGAATGVRLPLLLDSIASTRYDPLRETMLKMMAFSIWREHRDASVIRAVFGFVKLPSIADFERGTEESYQFLYAYDFRFAPPLEPVKP
jgi:hypothetical protein